MPGGQYTEAHVERLREQVAAHLSAPHRFECITSSPWPGWWAKISLFEPRRFEGRVLYLDLDVVVTGLLGDLAYYPRPFTICRNFERGKGKFNSSVIAWDAGVADHVYKRFSPSVMDRLHGDQDWIGEQMPDAATFPLGWCVSYKGQVRPRGVVPAWARVVVHHGRPKPWDEGA